jgi:hypothetical protein
MFNIFKTPMGAARIAIILAIALILCGAYYVKASGMLLPGPLSSHSSGEEPRGGAMSHADIERKCSHCHAPLHCVTDTRCQDCHIEIARERNDSTTLHGRLPGVSRCQNCHPEHRGENASLTVLSYLNVDHFQLAGFSLEKHVTNYDQEPFHCTTCHTQNGDQIHTVDCLTCHISADHKVMAEHLEIYGGDCVGCHDGRDRMMIGFDHEPYFPLQDGHANQECAACHTDKETGRQTWRDLPSDCLNCHPEPELHIGIFGDLCERCHTTTAWTPAVLIEHPFTLDHSAEGSLDQCETCHGGTYFEYPCGTCHSSEDMWNAHFPHGIYDFQNCIACHPTGRGSLATDSGSSLLNSNQP